MAVVHKIDPIQIDNPQIWRSGLQFVNVNNFVNFLLFLLNLLVRPDQMEDLQAVDEVVDFPHETFHEDDLRQTDAQVLQFSREGVQLAEIVQLHGGGEIQQHMSQVRTFVG